ncbi:hypothetical protein [Bosea sp. (in: a-proteobacteria)]|uniref:hypothetical protein n=1 Tax=Bosea sp. (in: a-proteobacteria) TaxID=1871050 RepID=UPI0031FF2FCC|nr:hypothetical protein [Bosea sp. (in: a-proteobacteria)]
MRVSTPKPDLASQRILAVAGLLAAMVHLPQAASAEEAKFRITTSWIVNYVEPKPRSVMQQNSYFVSLKSDGTVTERTETRIGNGWPGANLLETDTELGGGDRGQRRKVWRVVNETTLVRLLARESHTFAIWLRTQGKDSCTATLEWRLKPGFTLFESPKKPGKPVVRFAEPSWPTARCDVL